MAKSTRRPAIKTSRSRRKVPRPSARPAAKTKPAKSSRAAKAASKNSKPRAGAMRSRPARIQVKVGSSGVGLNFLSGKPGSSGAGAGLDRSQPRLTKTKIPAKELAQFRELLLAKRRQILGDMETMENEALRSETSNLSHLPVHMADMGTDNYEQEFTLSLVDRERKLVDEIDRALAKIDKKTYGICEGTGQMISMERLEAQPWARYSIEYARHLQRPGARRQSAGE